jgi:hypothetical protein
MKNLSLSIAMIAMIALIEAGCGGSGVNPGTCEEIAEACHDKDTGSGEPHDCHEAAEAEGATEASCAAIADACFAACE